MNYKLIFFIILMGFVSTDLMAQTNKIQTVVIDAGHGGKDPGAVGKKGKEKSITLAVAKKAGDYIKKKYPDVNVIYTRDKDVSLKFMNVPVLRTATMPMFSSQYIVTQWLIRRKPAGLRLL